MLSRSLACRVLSQATLDDASRYWQYDIEIALQEYHRSDQLLQRIQQADFVADVENWNDVNGRRIRDNSSESELIQVLGVPPETSLMSPIVLEGRWLDPSDTDKIVVNSVVLKDEPDIRIGDSITLRLNGRESEWQIVGIVRGCCQQSGNLCQQFPLLVGDP